MADAVYILSALTSLACAALLLNGWRNNGMRLLLWAGLCFAGLALNNVVLFVDQAVVPDIDLSPLRAGTALLGLSLLLFGLVWERR